MVPVEKRELWGIPEHSGKPMSDTYLANDCRINDFVAKANDLKSVPIDFSIGIERDGEVIAGVIFCDRTSTNICMHVASKPATNWITRALMAFTFGVAFDGFKVKRITAFVPESNERANKLDLRLGFKPEATIKDIYPDGGLNVLSMYREDCRYVKK